MSTHYWRLCGHPTFTFVDLNTRRFNPVTPDDISETDQHNFEIAFDICRRIIPIYIMDYNIAGPDGNGPPIIGENLISFNGMGNESYQIFTLRRNLYDNYGINDGECDTNNNPYGHVVKLCLWICSQICDRFVFDCDEGTDAITHDYTEEFTDGTGIEFTFDENYQPVENDGTDRDFEVDFEEDFKTRQISRVTFRDFLGNIEREARVIY
jgi:hypothetical protein